jgi:hypothetical protein
MSQLKTRYFYIRVIVCRFSTGDTADWEDKKKERFPLLPLLKSARKWNPEDVLFNFNNTEGSYTLIKSAK